MKADKKQLDVDKEEREDLADKRKPKEKKK